MNLFEILKKKFDVVTQTGQKYGIVDAVMIKETSVLKKSKIRFTTTDNRLNEYDVVQDQETGKAYRIFDQRKITVNKKYIFFTYSANEYTLWVE